MRVTDLPNDRGQITVIHDSQVGDRAPAE